MSTTPHARDSIRSWHEQHLNLRWAAVECLGEYTMESVFDTRPFGGVGPATGPRQKSAPAGAGLQARCRSLLSAAPDIRARHSHLGMIQVDG